MNVAQVRRVTGTKELYIADKWRSFALIFSCPPTEQEVQGKSATAAAADPLEETQVMEIEYVDRVMYDECAHGYKTLLKTWR